MSTTSSKFPPPTFAVPTVKFYFDPVCPFAFIASERIDDIAKFTGADITWVPVLLGGLYDLTKAVQGKAGSASDIPASAAKKALQSEDFKRELIRYQLPLKFHPQHPVSTVDAGRLLCAFPPIHRRALAHALFREYWLQGSNISSRATLLRIARSLKLTSKAAPTHAGPFSMTPNLPFELDESVFSDVKWSEQLRANTQEAFQRGAFGVPSFWIEEKQKLFWGQDRMHMLEAECISIKLSKPLDRIRQLERLHPRCLRTPPEDRVRRLKFWFDFSSPWAYLGYTQLTRLQRESGSGLIIELKPFLLGALFREIGTPIVPMQNMPEEKQRYARQDQEDWVRYWSAVNAQEHPPLPPVKLEWPDEFPIRSVTALRVALLEPKTIGPIYQAAWAENKAISSPEVLASVLTSAGFAGEKLVADATTGPRAAELKDKLKANTDEAVKLGLCGAPTYQIGKHVIWGQDKLNVVQDLILGWKPEVSNLKASVAAFPHFDYRI
ncbi:thioredoxin-like protein [Meredithblackwellia eburnea MCA 4105]